MSQLDKLLEIVTSQTANFKVYYMKLVKDSVTNEFRSLPKKIAMVAHFRFIITNAK